jgi:hypothetical protein
MSAKSPIPRKARCVHLSDEEHRQMRHMGGAKWLRGAIAEAWGKLPADQRRSTPREGGGVLESAWMAKV